MSVEIVDKNEKQAKEMIQKLGLKPVAGISRVTFRKKDNSVFSIDAPKVYRSPAGNYVVFGDCKVDNFQERMAEAQSKVQKDPASIQADLAAAAADAEKAEKSGESKIEEEDDNEPVDESGLDAADIDIIVQQANVSRGKAVKALKAHNGDIVNAIMELTK
ncbi:hypothetical protein ACO0RG_002143 [Hanseniaspora osmophila]|uniref:Nascent polypeptide-associated complex subunit alpha n=1 Tax=Hanseniaspora osmophila TaxID=56408 RepID=A0A1E5RIA3_9ASCO|nr:Nascent polypeptide-associated complex subunit alpha [Hanseniaspora osmophila]